jgi:hypothetical protein
MLSQSDPKPNHMICLGIVLFGFFLFSVFPSLLSGYRYSILSCSDSAVHIANEMKMLNPAIFPRDIIIVRELEIRPYADFRTFGFIVFLSRAFSLNLLLVNFILNNLLLIAFLCGVYLLACYLFRSRPVGMFCALASICPMPANGGLIWGFWQGGVIPHNLGVTLAPYCALLFFYTKSKSKTYLTYLIMGFLTNVYPLAFFHLSLIFGLTELLEERSMQTLKRLFLSALLFALGSLPTLYQAFTITVNVGGVTERSLFEQAIQRRYSYLMIESLSKFFRLTNRYLIFLALGSICYFLRRRWFHFILPQERIYNYFIISALTFTVIGMCVENLTNVLRHYFLSRISAYSYIWILPQIVGLSVLLLKRKGIKSYLIALLLLSFTIFGRSYYINLFRLALQGSLHPVNIYLEAPVDEDYLAMCRWAKENTPFDAYFIVHPDRFSSYFRIYAERGILVTYKDGGHGLLASQKMVYWWNLYNRVKKAYRTNDEQAFAELQREFRVDYLIADRGAPLTLSFPVVYDRGNFVIYKLPGMR